MTADPAVELNDPALFATYARVDWLVPRSWRYLHAIPYGPWTLDHYTDIACDWSITHPVRLACGRIAKELRIPGVFSRGGFGGGLPRCLGCCRALGGPPGNGSPKNSAEWRVILGLDTAGAGGTGT